MTIIATAVKTTPAAVTAHALGTGVYVYGSGFGHIVREPYRTPIEAAFGHPSDKHRVVDVQLAVSSEVIRCATVIVVDAGAARTALHAIADGKIVAGGPSISREKLLSLPDADSFEIVEGVPAELA